MSSHLCIFCLGSNYDSNTNIAYARKRLSEEFDDVVFAGETLTVPIGMKNSSMFLNQTGYFHSDCSVEEIKLFFKEIERECGRTPDDKLKEIVKADIDLLIYDNEILKPKDLTYPHVVRGLEELNIRKG